MKKQIDLLVVYPLPVELIENVENVFDYGSMQSCFMHQHLKNRVSVLDYNYKNFIDNIIKIIFK